MKPLFGAASLLVFASWLAPLGACGGPPPQSCASERWDGRCKLARVVKVKEAPLPAPHVVLQSIYDPLPNPASPAYSPPAAIVEVTLPADRELEYRDHLDRHPEVACSLAPAPAGACEQGKLVAAVPEFVPGSAGQASSGPRGCARIEAEGGERPKAEGAGAGTNVEEPIDFEQGSAALDEAARTRIKAWVTLLGRDPSLACVAVVSMITTGETAELAQQRTRVVREALVAAGADGERLISIAGAQRQLGTGAPPPPEPKQRQTVLRILIQDAPKP